MKKSDRTNCGCGCKKDVSKKSGFLNALLYALIPHTGCILFLLFAILGVTTATAFFKPLLANSSLFYGLVAISFIFTTISAFFYLKNANMLSIEGIRTKWRYLFMLYGTVIAVNLLFFTVIFPYSANLIPKPAAEDAVLLSSESKSKLLLRFSIPCSGHAALVIDELNKLEGVEKVSYNAPDIFEVTYDSTKVTEEKILSQEVCKEFNAKVTSYHN